jgi:hypothetical protein
VKIEKNWTKKMRGLILWKILYVSLCLPSKNLPPPPNPFNPKSLSLKCRETSGGVMSGSQPSAPPCFQFSNDTLCGKCSDVELNFMSGFVLLRRCSIYGEVYVVAQAQVFFRQSTSRSVFFTFLDVWLLLVGGLCGGYKDGAAAGSFV